MKTIRIIIKGNVQGVFFRANAERLAGLLNIKGYVKNKEKNVEIVAQGEEKDLNQLIEFCKRGPEGARVSDIEIKNEKPKNFKCFRIVL